MKASLLAIYYVAYAAVYVGWLLFESADPDLWRYSWRYVAFLAVAALPFLAPPVLIAMKRQLGPRRFQFALAPLVLLGVGGYLVAGQIYYNTRSHRFDPYLQKPGKRFDLASRSAGDGRLRIITMGGSTTECGHLEQHDRYPQLLETILNARVGSTEVEVLNAGMPWWTTKHTLINYVTYLRPLKPDVVVVMHAVNDAYRSFSSPSFAVGEYDVQWSHYYGAAMNGAVPPTFERWLLEMPASTWYPNLHRSVDYPLADFVSLPMYRQHLRTLVEYLRADGVNVLLVTQPSLYKEEMPPEHEEMLVLNWMYFGRRTGFMQTEYPNGRSMHRAMAAYNSALSEVAAETDVNLLDADARVPRDATHFVDDVHKTPLSSRLLAEMVADTITDAGWN